MHIFLPVFGLEITNVEDGDEEMISGSGVWEVGGGGVLGEKELGLVPGICTFPYQKWQPERVIQCSCPINSPALQLRGSCELLLKIFVG